MFSHTVGAVGGHSGHLDAMLCCCLYAYGIGVSLEPEQDDLRLLQA